MILVGMVIVGSIIAWQLSYADAVGRTPTEKP
jgi:hypothetical protein